MCSSVELLYRQGFDVCMAAQSIGGGGLKLAYSYALHYGR